jgi:hypothetical protein
MKMPLTALHKIRPQLLTEKMTQIRNGLILNLSSWKDHFLQKYLLKLSKKYKDKQVTVQD